MSIKSYQKISFFYNHHSNLAIILTILTFTILFNIIKKIYRATKTPHADENQCRGVLLSWKNETAENQPLHFTKKSYQDFLEGKWKKVLFYAAVE